MKGKWLTGVLVLAMAAVTLAGCGAKDETKEKVEQVPLLKALIVPLDKLAEMRVKLEQDGTRENILCNKAAALMK